VRLRLLGYVRLGKVEATLEVRLGLGVIDKQGRLG
jgi:hypothetical protein